MLCICSLYSLLNLVVPFFLSATSVLCESAWGLCSEEEKRKCFSLFRLLLADVGCEGVCQWKRLSILCHTGVTGQKWANTPEGLSQLLLPSSLPEQSCSCACACRWSCEGCCAGLLLPCPGRVQAQTWRVSTCSVLQLWAPCRGLAGVAGGGGWVTSFCLQPAAAGMASPERQQPEHSKEVGRRNQLDQGCRL